MSSFSSDQMSQTFDTILWEAGIAEAKGITDGPYAKYAWIMEYDSLAAPRVDVQDQGGLRVRPSAPGLVRIVSNDANDTAAGSGARSILVRGLGAGSSSGVAGPWKSEVVATNGTMDAFTTEEFLDAQDITVVDAGATNSNEGAIDAYIGIDHQLRIGLDPSGIGNGVSKSGHLFIPMGWYGTINGGHIGWTGNNELSLWFGLMALGSSSQIWPVSKRLVSSQDVPVPGLTAPQGAHVCVQGQRAGGGASVPVDINVTVALARL